MSTKSPAFKFGAIGLAVAAAGARTYSLFFQGNEPAIQAPSAVTEPEPQPEPPPPPPPPQDTSGNEAQPEEQPPPEEVKPEEPPLPPEQIRKSRGFTR